ncbi:hypothetical protein ABAZ39_07180 [Azospirillum argentinense]|uniref:Pectate lyase superfamily protein domain-containing protein n=1 Tax=Azospirillum argentinense TaxID=2970906 RepID=A0A060DLU4_9PROT|nr:right-handed parallel beta-helix repeat-containing protein [Azospirillum argentinense]AIB11784.1 hypothetical protein ABAZ39_07180 [Azospirillum argentinense]EZQ09758.1 hypothetical protein ABAZ39_08600 [Azospirillum argentinense]
MTLWTNDLSGSVNRVGPDVTDARVTPTGSDIQLYVSDLAATVGGTTEDVTALQVAKLDKDGDAGAVTVAGRALADRAADVVDVMDAPYSAVGNGVADDTAALVSAIAAATNGRILVINYPLYLASPQSVVVPTSVTLRFEGAGTLKWDFGQLQGMVVASAGGDFTSMPVVSVAGSTLVTTAKLNRVEVAAGGSGYAQGDVLTVPGVTGTAPPVVVETVDGSGAILQARPDYNALGSATAIPANPVSITGGSGSGAALTLYWNINTVSVTAGGAYITPPPVTISGTYVHKPVLIPRGRYPTIFGAIEAPSMKPIFTGNYRYVHGAIRSPTCPVTWWGAAGGVDSTHAFQCAAFQAQAVDGVVEVPPQSVPYRIGTVALGIQYVLRSCAVVGPSRRDVPYTGTGVLIKLLDGHDGHMFIKPMRTGAVQLRNLRLDGNQPMQAPGAKSSAIFIEDDWTRSYYWGGSIESCWVTDTAWHGIYIGWHQDAGQMRDVWVQYAGGGNWASTSTITDNGVHGILNRAYDWKYSNVDVGRCYGDGLHIERGSQIQITSLASYGNGGCGLSLDATSTDLMIATSAFDHNKKHGVYLGGAVVGSIRSGRSIDACVFRGNSRSLSNEYSDIYVASDHDLSVSGCSFDGSSDSTRPKYCIEFDAGLSPSSVAWSGNSYGTSGRLSYGTALTNNFSKLFVAGGAGVGLHFDTAANNFAMEGVTRFASGLTFGDEALSAYDVGSWTPTLTASTTSGTHTYSVQAGEYVRIGNLVFVSGRLEVTAKDAALNGNARISGLPFVSSNAMVSNHDSGVQLTSVTGLTPTAGYDRDVFGGIPKGVSYISLKASGTSGTGTINHTNLGSAPTFQFSGMYRV